MDEYQHELLISLMPYSLHVCVCIFKPINGCNYTIYKRRESIEREANERVRERERSICMSLNQWQ